MLITSAADDIYPQAGNIVNASVRLSVRHAFSSWTTRWNLTKPATWLPRVVRVSDSNIIFLSAPCDLRVGSVCPSRYLLNNWAEFNQFYYMTFTCGKGVREQQYFFRPSPH